MADPSTCAPLTAHSIAQAHTKINKYITRTDLITSEALNRLASSPQPRQFFNNPQAGNSSEPNPTSQINPPKLNLYFKRENLQRTGAFKARGAFHALCHLIEEEGVDEIRRKGVTTASSGNHAQGLALAAVTFGVPAFIVMPKTSTKSKVDGVARTLGVENLDDCGGRSSKGRIIFCGSSNEEKKLAVDETMRESGCVFVPPYAHPDIILGQGTCAMELEEQFLELRPERREMGLDAVVAPIGGGGLLGGIATWFGEKLGTKVFGAEPLFQGADDARRGIQQGARIEHVASATIADGLRTPVGPINWDIVRDKTKVEDIYAVGEEEIKMAMKLLYDELGMLVEPSGCVPLAVVLFDDSFRAMVAKQVDGRGKAWDVAILLSGGNTTVETIQAISGEWDLSKVQ